ncbi:MAG: alpha/beta hydrolase [Planctomycetaceae bacterium]|nr:alpha/beta hydrolase [Planctomycetaceae bacterium]
MPSQMPELRIAVLLLLICAGCGAEKSRSSAPDNASSRVEEAVFQSAELPRQAGEFPFAEPNLPESSAETAVSAAGLDPVTVEELPGSSEKFGVPKPPPSKKKSESPPQFPPVAALEMPQEEESGLVFEEPPWDSEEPTSPMAAPRESFSPLPSQQEQMEPRDDLAAVPQVIEGHVSAATERRRQAEATAPSTVIRRPGAQLQRQGYSNELVYFATNRQPEDSPRASTDPDLYFGAQRGTVTYGVCEVSMPYRRAPGTLPEPSVLALEFTQDPARHVVLMQIQLKQDEEFWRSLRADLDTRPQRQLMLFVHGYSASFRDAARRTAQIAYDMNYQGAAMFFSWPAGSETEGLNRWNYTNDLRRADESCEDFLTVIEAIAARAGAERIHLIVHSMGNHLVTESLKTMADRLGPSGTPVRMFDAVAMAAPDISSRDFAERTADRIRPFSSRFTVYASKHDKALQFSKQLNGWDPLGLLSEYSLQIARKDAFELVDVSALSDRWFDTGHIYYGDMPEVMRDVQGLFLGQSVQNRNLLATPPVFRLVRHIRR